MRFSLPSHSHRRSNTSLNPSSKTGAFGCKVNSSIKSGAKRSLKHKQRGVALIVVLLVVAMVTIVATEMAGRLQLQVKRVANIKDANQAYWYAMGAEEYAVIALRQVYENADGVIHNKQTWATSSLTFPLPGGGIEAQLVDMQSCFNLNALRPASGQGSANANANQSTKEAFQRLLTNSELNIPSFNADTVRDSLVDWLDADSNLSGSFGAEDPEYESRQFPYLAANGLMQNKTELRLVNGVEPAWIMKLMPLVCAIPGQSTMKINVNTFTQETAPVLAALTGASLADANNLINNIPYDTREDFVSQSEVAAQGLSDEQKEWFDVTTEYFILHTKTSYNNATFAMSTVFKVGESNNVQVVRREFGGKL